MCRTLFIVISILYFFNRFEYSHSAILQNVLIDAKNQLYLSKEEKLKLKNEVKEMFYFGYNNYMKYAYPKDELNPIHCNGRGPDFDKSNININDVLGDYQLTLVDSLNTLAIIGNVSEFQKAVQLVIENLSFDKESTVQLFEVTIRVLGSLVSTHLLITDPTEPLGRLKPPKYTNQLLLLARDLGKRLLRAFEATGTGIPRARVNLRSGQPPKGFPSPEMEEETCLAGAGSLLLEFSALGRLLGDPKFESLAKRSVRALWKHRSNVTGLLGTTINIQTGQWTGAMSGLGAGHDSFYEYLLKGYILLDDGELHEMFTEAMASIRFYMKRGRKSCSKGTGYPPMYVNVDMLTGQLSNQWMDSLMAAWPSVMVLNGEVDEAICLHAIYYTIWKKYGVLPERFNWYSKSADVRFYPLRPELIESTYFLYRATNNPYYLHVGREILQSLQTKTKTKCGYATVHDVNNMSLEDRMESFFLSETCKYLYLLFDEDNAVNRLSEDLLFTTEGHLLPIKRLREMHYSANASLSGEHLSFGRSRCSIALPGISSCEGSPRERQFTDPMSPAYLDQINSFVGTKSSNVS